MKILDDVTCPHCKKEFEHELDVDKIPARAEPVKGSNIKLADTTSNQATVQVEKPEPEIKIMPSKDEPFLECKTCNKSHENHNYSVRPNKKCNN